MAQSFQKDHLCWQQAVGHERRDTMNYNSKNKEVFNFDKQGKILDNVQHIRAKKDFYSKHMLKYMDGTDVITDEFAEPQSSMDHKTITYRSGMKSTLNGTNRGDDSARKYSPICR